MAAVSEAPRVPTESQLTPLILQTDTLAELLQEVRLSAHPALGPEINERWVLGRSFPEPQADGRKVRWLCPGGQPHQQSIAGGIDWGFPSGPFEGSLGPLDSRGGKGRFSHEGSYRLGGQGTGMKAAARDCDCKHPALLDRWSLFLFLNHRTPDS